MSIIRFGKMKIPISYLRGNGECHYDPATRRIYVYNGILSMLARGVMSRSKDWIVAHELGHAVLDRLPTKEREQAEEVFGSFEEDEYNGELVSELVAKVNGYDRDEFVSARASMCAEEDFAETFAYVRTGGSSDDKKIQKFPKLRAKVRAIEEIFIKRGEG